MCSPGRKKGAAQKGGAKNQFGPGGRGGKGIKHSLLKRVKQMGDGVGEWCKKGYTANGQYKGTVIAILPNLAKWFCRLQISRSFVSQNVRTLCQKTYRLGQNFSLEF
jgi:hypothetical protein